MTKLPKFRQWLIALFLMAVPLQGQIENEPGIVEYKLPFQGGEVTASFNTLNADVIRQLLIMSYLVKEGQPYQTIEVPWVNGKQINLKLNLDEPESRLRLKKIAENYRETFHNKFVIARMNYPGGQILAVFNTAKEDVMDGLQKLNAEVDEGKFFVEQTFGLLNETDLQVKLNLNEKHVRNALRRLAVKYTDTPVVREPNPVTVNLPFKRGNAVGIFDLNKPQVIDTLRKLSHKANEAQPLIAQTFELWNGEKLSVKLNMDNENVRKALKSIADNYHELLGKADTNLYRITFGDGRIKGMFDLNKEEVIETLTDLDENVDVNKPYEIKRIPLENETVIYVRLNVNSRETIEKLKEIANDYEEELHHIPNVFEVIELPYMSNIARIVLNVGKDDVLQRLKSLSKQVTDSIYVVKNIHLHNGTIIKIKLGINNLLTLATLRQISDKYTIIANNTDYRYVTKTLPFANGNAIAVFDVSNLEVIDTLRNLDNRVVNSSYQATEFRLFDGTVLSVLLDTDDPVTRETLKDIAVRYEECIEPEVPQYVTKSFPWSDGNAVAVFDLNRPEVVEALNKINNGDPSDSPSSADSTSTPAKLDLENPQDREYLKNLSVEYKEYIKRYVPNLITVNFEWEKGRAIGVYDINKPHVIQGLSSLKDSNGTVVLEELGNNVTIRINLKNRETREVLRSLAEQYEEIERPHLPHHVIQVFSSGGKTIVGVFDVNNPEVLKTLQDLDNDEEPGQIYNFPLSKVSSPPVAFDINNPNTQAKLKNIAEKFEELSNPNYVTVRMPFIDGFILAVFDMNKPEVISGLKELNNTDKSPTVYLIPLNDIETMPLKLNLENPMNRNALRNLADKYEEYMFPKSDLVTKLFSWKNGRGMAAFDMIKPEVIQGLTNLQNDEGKDEVFPLSSGENFTVSLDLNDANVRKSLDILSETYEEYTVPTFEPQTLKFDGYVASAIYDVSKPEVVKGLREISSGAETDEPMVTKNFTLINGELLEVKYNPRNATARLILQNLADRYQEIQESNFVGVNIDFKKGNVGIILDLNKPEVLSLLERLDKEVNLDEPFESVDIPVQRDKFLTVKLNMKNQKTRDAIREIAEYYKEIMFKNESNLVSFELPFDKGFITFTVDSFKHDVVEELRSMTKEAEKDSPGGEIRLQSGNFMPFKIKTNDLRTRQRLENKAEKFEEVVIDPPPNYVIKILPYHRGKLVAVLDVNKKEVQETLQMLNDMVDESKPYLQERIPLSKDSILQVKLNIDDSNVRDILCGIAHDCDDVPHNVGPKFVSHNMPFNGGIAMAIFDVNKIEVIKKLIDLQAKVADGQPNITRDFPLEDGSVLQVKLDINDPETRRALQKIAEKYEEVPESRRSRTVILELPFKGGLIIATFDVSNDEETEKLTQTLAGPYNKGSSLLVEIPLANGTLLNLNVNINDPQVRNAMRNLAIEYQEIFDPLEPRHMIFKLPFKNGVIVFVFDTERETVVKKLEELGKHLGDNDSYVKVKLPLGNELKIDPNDLKTREVLAEIAVDYNEIFNTTDPHLSHHQLRYDNGRIFVTFDTSDPKVVQKLKDLNNQVRKNEPHVTIKLLQEHEPVEHIKLNIDDPKVRSELEGIANYYRQLSHTELRQNNLYSHYKLPFSEGNILMTLRSDDPTVLQVLEKLHHEASKRDSPLAIRLPLPDGSVKQFKLDLNDNSTRQSLESISDRYREVIAEKPLTKIVNYEFPLEENKKLRFSLDLAKKEVINTLLELNDETDGEILDLNSDTPSETKIKLDLKNPYTQRELKRVADRYELVNNDHNKPMDEAGNLTYRLPFKGGHVIVVLNPYDPEVISELLELNSKVNTTQRRLILRLPLEDNVNISIRLNIDNPEVREVLKRIAIKYSEVTEEVQNNIVPYQLPFNQGKLEIVLDLSDPEVIETLLSLSKQDEDADKPATIKIPSIDGADQNVKLNLDNPAVRNVLQDIALEYKISWHSQKQFSGPNLQLLKFELPFEDGKLVFTVDIRNKTVTEGLRELSRKVDVKKPRIATKITLSDGTILNIRLNLGNPKTREALKKISFDYEEIPNTEASEGAGIPKITVVGTKPAAESVPFDIPQVITENSSKEELGIINKKETMSISKLNQGGLPVNSQGSTEVSTSKEKELSVTNKKEESSETKSNEEKLVVNSRESTDDSTSKIEKLSVANEKEESSKEKSKQGDVLVDSQDSTAVSTSKLEELSIENKKKKSSKAKSNQEESIVKSQGFTDDSSSKKEELSIANKKEESSKAKSNQEELFVNRQISTDNGLASKIQKLSVANTREESSKATSKQEESFVKSQVSTDDSTSKKEKLTMSNKREESSKSTSKQKELFVKSQGFTDDSSSKKEELSIANKKEESSKAKSNQEELFVNRQISTDDGLASKIEELSMAKKKEESSIAKSKREDLFVKSQVSTDDSTLKKEELSSANEKEESSKGKSNQLELSRQKLQGHSNKKPLSEINLLAQGKISRPRRQKSRPSRTNLLGQPPSLPSLDVSAGLNLPSGDLALTA